MSAEMLRTRWAALLAAAPRSPSSWSVTLSSLSLDARPVDGVGIITQIFDPYSVANFGVNWPSDRPGRLVVAAAGLNSGSAYVLGCSFLSFSSGPDLTVKIGNQTTTIPLSSGTTNESVAFVAPASGYATITISPSSPRSWAWNSCTFATAT